jgi:hypothetical protein
MSKLVESSVGMPLDLINPIAHVAGSGGIRRQVIVTSNLRQTLALVRWNAFFERVDRLAAAIRSTLDLG